MLINRKWAMPNKLTFGIKPIKELITKYHDDNVISIDPFANNSKLATYTNDINPEMETTHHMDALDFLKSFDDDSVEIVYYDPPYSVRQVSECYKQFGYEVTQKTTQSSFWSKHKDEIKRIIKKNGIVMSFGWNSMGCGKTRGFEMVEVLLVPHGGAHNDTIITVEKYK